MAEENDEKKSWKDRLTNFMSLKTLFDMKNQLAEFKAADKIGEFKPTTNINIGGVHHTVNLNFPDGTDLQAIADVLDRMPTPDIKIGKINLDTPEKVKWFEQTFHSTAYASAATLSSVAGGIVSLTGKVDASVDSGDDPWKDEKVDKDDED